MRAVRAAAVVFLICACAEAVPAARRPSDREAIPAARGPAYGHAAPAGKVDARALARMRSGSVRAPAAGWQPPEHERPPRPDPPNLRPPAAPKHSNEVSDPSPSSARPGLARRLGSPDIAFAGISDTGFFPPDPVIAVGPNHVVTGVNSEWAIYDKSGTQIFQTSATDWFKESLTGLGTDPLGSPYDPQIVYDSASGRWIVLYLATDEKTESWILISVSDTADPDGQWTNYVIAGDENGSDSVANWTDFPSLGVDGASVYLATNQFTYADNTFVYSKLRIFTKSSLYGGGEASWTDFWDLRDPDSPDEQAFALRHVDSLNGSPAEYFVSNSPFTTGTYVTLWTVTGAPASPDVSSVNVSVAASTAPPNADQLGGSDGTDKCPAPCLIDTGDGRIVSAFYRNGSIWFAHAVAAGANDAYANARYARIDVATRRAVEDQSFGAGGCWSFYPALAVDGSGNMAMVFARSCGDRYVGARFTGRSVADASLQASTLLVAGENNYVYPGTTAKNRWGDYFRAAVDPSDPSHIWIIAEYAGADANNWATYIARTAVTCTAPAIPTAGSNGPIAEGQTLRLTASSTPGASYFWSGPNGFQSTLQNPTIPNATREASGTYSVSASFGDCGSLSTSVDVMVVGAGGGCAANSSTLCLSNGRFSVTAAWRKSDGTTGAGHAVALTSDTGYFWFFGPTNIEVVTKVLNACVNPFNAYWVFAAGLTNVGVTLTFTDTQTGVPKGYQNALGTAFPAIQDTRAFETCP